MSAPIAEPLELPGLFDGAADEGAPGEGGGERTLDDVVVGAWEALTAASSGAAWPPRAACPLCGASMRPRSPAGGRCERCVAELE